MPKGTKMLSEQVADQILDMVTIEKRFKPGDKLPNENDFSQELGVSRTTLREAVRFLVAHNVLEIKRGRKSKIRISTPFRPSLRSAFFLLTNAAYISLTVQYPVRSLHLQPFQIRRYLHLLRNCPLLRISLLHQKSLRRCCSSSL